MVVPAAGAIVLVRFPFSDLSQSKRRPALVLADVGRGDYVLCQITSKPYSDPHAQVIEPGAFATGSLPVTSYVRPGKLFTASHDIMTSHVATLTPAALSHVVDAVAALLRSGAPPYP